MCEESTGHCVARPQPCLSLPAVAGPDRCLCHISGDTHKICEENEACDASCFLPDHCPDPTTSNNWTDYNAQIRSKVEPLMVQATELTMECEEHTFTSLSVKAREYKKTFTAVCTDQDSSWSMDHCTFPTCPQLQLDTNTVQLTELWLTHNATTQGSVLKLACKGEAEEFEFGSGITRLLAVCNRR